MRITITLSRVDPRDHAEISAVVDAMLARLPTHLNREVEVGPDVDPGDSPSLRHILLTEWNAERG